MIASTMSPDHAVAPEPTLALRIENLTDKLAFNHASFLKDDVPLAGRKVIAGVRVSF